eukprot:scaffold17098_cov31-Prasinocladus_malaysianus.AAC.1
MSNTAGMCVCLCVGGELADSRALIRRMAAGSYRQVGGRMGPGGKSGRSERDMCRRTSSRSISREGDKHRADQIIHRAFIPKTMASEDLSAHTSKLSINESRPDAGAPQTGGAAEAEADPRAALEKKIRNLRKKIRQCESTQAKKDEGRELTPEEKAKLDNKAKL